MTTRESYAVIPQELKERCQWVCISIADRNGHPTKIPWSIIDSKVRMAKTNTPATWMSFDEAIKLMENGRYPGLGFILSKSDPYVFIDLDHVVDNSGIEDWARDMIDVIGSYTELSQSGTGIHIIARARKPGPRCRIQTHQKFEIYESRRLVVFTGALVSESTDQIVDAQSAVDEIYFRIFGQPEQSISPRKAIAQTTRSVQNSDPILIQKAMSAQNGGKFKRLWNGDMSDYHEDNSAADLALCYMLAFWSQNDPVQIDRLFRASGLMRDKWDRRRGERTYGEMTIDKATEQTIEVYNSSFDTINKCQTQEERLVAVRNDISQAKKIGTAKAIYSVVDSLALLPMGEYEDSANELKQAVPQLDLRELKGAVSKIRKSKTLGEGHQHPILKINDRQLRDIGSDAIRFLCEANLPPILYTRSGALCQVIIDERGLPSIREVTVEIMISQLAKTADFVNETEHGLKNIVPPKSIAFYVLAEGNWPFPALEAITCCPTIRQNGTIMQNPGYDENTMLYYHNSEGSEVMGVSESPSQDNLETALNLVDELLHDFPFDCPASKANAVALLLSPIIQPAIGDCTPLILIDAPSAGSGKSLLAIIAGIISAGVQPDFTTAPYKEEEWPKKITAILSAGPSLVVIDNVNGVLKSSDFAMLLTARNWKDRMFGKNTETVVFPNRAVWVATGNNIQLGGDIPRRCIWIRIDSRQARPHERGGFKHPDLIAWVFANRSQLLWALLTICRAWYAAGCPLYTAQPFGSFEKWTRTVGSILAYAKINGFLENQGELLDQSDTESNEWEAFLIKCLDIYGSTPFTPQVLIQDIETGKLDDVVPISISDAVNGKGQKCSKVGVQLKARSGKRYGSKGLRFERGPKKSSGNTWIVMTDSIDAVENEDDFWSPSLL